MKIDESIKILKDLSLNLPLNDLLNVIREYIPNYELQGGRQNLLQFQFRRQGLDSGQNSITTTSDKKLSYK